MSYIYFAPFSIINRYVYAKLTHQPFILLETSLLDLATIGPFTYLFYIHMNGMYAENAGMGL